MSYESSKEERHAYDIGRRHGRNAADWAIQDLWGGRSGREAQENAKNFIKGMSEGDPEVIDRFVVPNLSGEWADGMTPEKLYDAIGISEDDVTHDDPYSTAYEQGAQDGFWGRLESSAKEFLGSNENPLNHSEAKKLLDYAHADYMDAHVAKPGSTRRAYSKGRAHASVTAVGVSHAPAIETREAMLLRGKINSIPNPHKNPNWSSPASIPLTELEMWVNNDEGLYNWWKGSRMSMRNFIKENRSEISQAVYNAINRPPRGNPSNRNLAADFAAGATSGKAFGSIFIEGNTIYSYGKHWPIATRHPETKIAYRNANRYSVTTSKHTGAVGYALAMAGYNVIDSDRTENFEVIAPSSEFVEARQRAKAVEAVKAQKRMRAKTDKLGAMAGLKPGQLPNPKKMTEVEIKSLTWAKAIQRLAKQSGNDYAMAHKDNPWQALILTELAPRPSRISKQQSFLAKQYGKHLKKEIDKKRHENPSMTLIGRKCLEITMTGGRCEGNFGAAYGMKDGSAFIKGVFTKVPGGRVKAILYLDEAKAKREGLKPVDRPWKHDFSSLDAKAVRVKGGLVIKSKIPLWENR